MGVGKTQTHFLFLAGVIPRPGRHALGSDGVGSLDVDRDASFFTEIFFEIPRVFMTDALLFVRCLG